MPISMTGIAAREVTIPKDYPGKRFWVGFKRSGGHGSSFVGIVIGALDEHIETEPNDAAEKSSAISVPGAINGRFSARRDRDWFQF